MPNSWRVALAETMPEGCPSPDSHAPQHLGHTQPVQDCSLKPCPDSPPNVGLGFKIDKPEMPLFVLCLVWLIVNWLHDQTNQRIPRQTEPPDGRRVPLIYRFCTLLN
jgi:hypothetical protein